MHGILNLGRSVSFCDLGSVSRLARTLRLFRSANFESSDKDYIRDKKNGSWEFASVDALFDSLGYSELKTDRIESVWVSLIDQIAFHH